MKPVPVAQIRAGANQPRAAFSEQAHQQLVESIRQRGVLQPVILRSRRDDAGYELVAGERRWRAAKEAGLREIPSMIVEASDSEALEIALVENVQREDLNPMERARSCRRLAELAGVTHEEVARRIGKERATVTNLIRLLALPDRLQDMVSRGTLSFGHARALLSVPSKDESERLARRIVRERLSVREAEKLCNRAKNQASAQTGESPKKGQGVRDPWIRDLEDQITKALSVRAKLTLQGKKNGTLTLRFADLGDLDRIVKRLGI